MRITRLKFNGLTRRSFFPMGEYNFRRNHLRSLIRYNKVELMEKWQENESEGKVSMVNEGMTQDFLPVKLNELDNHFTYMKNNRNF